MTVTHMPHLDAIAREGEHRLALEAVWHLGYIAGQEPPNATTASSGPREGCPPWCEDHTEPGELIGPERNVTADHRSHTRTRKGPGLTPGEEWVVEVDQTGDDAPCVMAWTGSNGDLTPAQARAFAAALVKAADTLEGGQRIS